MTSALSTKVKRTAPVAISRVDHTGITVSSLEDALDFWVNALGFRHLYTETYENAPFIENLVGVEGASVMAAMLEGYGHRIELLEYQAPANRTIFRPRSCDVGSVHIALHIDDMDLALARVAQVGWMPVIDTQLFEGRGQDGLRVIYVRAPDGVTVEFIEKPKPETGFWR